MIDHPFVQQPPENKKVYAGPVSGGPLDMSMLEAEHTVHHVIKTVQVTDNFVRTVTGSYEYVKKGKEKKGWWQWMGWEDEKTAPVKETKTEASDPDAAAGQDHSSSVRSEKAE